MRVLCHGKYIVQDTKLLFEKALINCMRKPNQFLHLNYLVKDICCSRLCFFGYFIYRDTSFISELKGIPECKPTILLDILNYSRNTREA